MVGLLGRLLGAADKLDADAMVMMTGDAAGDLGDQHEFTDRRLDVGLE